MRSKFLTEDDVQVLFRVAARKAIATNQPVNQETIPVNNEQLDKMADRIAHRVFQAMNYQPVRYHGKPESTKPGFQGLYANELFRLSGLYEREWQRLHGGN